jgi:hypothetical protein
VEQMMSLSKWRRAAVVVSGALLCGCVLHGKGHVIQFARLEPADRIVVRTRSGEAIKTIDDKTQIDVAVRFIRQYETGWRDPISGPRVPRFMLDFFVGERRIGSYGIGVRYIVSDPTTDGFWSRDAPEGDVKRLAGTLGLELNR